MKKLLSTMAVLMGAVLIGFSPGAASATLIYQQHGLEKVVYDTSTELYWIQDLTAFTNQSYLQQLQNIATNFAAKAYFGIDNWHMANSTEFGSLYGYGEQVSVAASPVRDMHAFNYTSFWAGPQMYDFTWSGRFDAPYTVGGLAHHAGVLMLGESVSSPSSIEGFDWYWDVCEDMAGASLGAWVVGTKQAAAVPEPCTVLLMGLGLVAARLCGGLKRART